MYTIPHQITYASRTIFEISNKSTSSLNFKTHDSAPMHPFKIVSFYTPFKASQCQAITDREERRETGVTTLA